ncbi:MAG TPA: CHAT domain-containing protein [Thermoanaerobaculia bacterium]|nr:CHAT domain-containing protein [Thermoanaerobaculia bacterium]
MANSKTRLIISLIFLGGCLGLSLLILQGWTRPLRLRPTRPVPASSSAITKSEKPIRDVPVPPSREIRQRIDRESVHRYTLVLAKGQFLDAVVEQEGVDLTVTISGPGRKLHTIDSRWDDRGPEEIRLFAPAQGRYRIEVDSEEQSGLYRFRVRSIRPASPEDRLEADTEEVFHHARALRLESSPEAQEQAFEKFLTAGESWGKLGNKHRQADALERAAEVWGEDTDRAEQTLRLRRKTLELFQAVDDVPGIVRQWNCIGQSYGMLGWKVLEQEHYERALRLAREWGDKIGEAAAVDNLGNLWKSKGELWKALDAYEESRGYWHDLGNRKEEVKTLIDIGLIHFSLGNVGKSLDLYLQAYRQLGSRGEIELRAQIESRIAEALEKLARWNEALAHARLALDLRRAYHDQRGEAVVLAGMSLSYQGLGDFRQAREAQKEALSIFRRMRKKEDIMVASLNLGVLLLRQGDAPQAVPLLEGVLVEAKDQKRPDVEAVALHALARARLRNPIVASHYAEEAIKLMESIRRKAVREDLKAMYLEAQRGCYELLVDLLIADPPAHTPVKSIARAFEVIERRKARNLLDSLTSPRPPLNPEVAANRQEIQREIEHLAAEIERRGQLGLPSKDLKMARSRSLERLSNLDARFLAQEIELPSTPSIPLRNAQQELDDNTLLLVYHLGAERSLLLLVSPDQVEVHALPPEKEIEDSAREFHKRLSTSQRPLDEKLAAQTAEDLGRMLLGPVAGRLGGKDLVVVPDGALHSVPFGVLIVAAPRDGDRPGVRGSPARLFERHKVVSLPSVSVLAAIRERKSRRSAPPGVIALFAAPALRDEQYRDIPNTQREAEAIKALLPPGARAVMKLGFDATKEAAVSGLLSRVQIVHFAAHATIDREHPELSGIVLAQKNRQGVALDSYLRVHDIWALDIPADLVVLSACKTAQGKEMRAEGLLGLTQSFFHAGASSMLVNLWDVDDESTPEFMKVFYTSLYVRHRSPAEALRDAQIRMSRHERWHSPYYWAGFVLQGEWR